MTNLHPHHYYHLLILATFALVAIGAFYFITRDSRKIQMAIQDDVNSLNTATAAINAAATTLGALPAEITAAIAAAGTSPALETAVADVGTATTALGAAVAAVQAALPAPTT